MPDDTTPKDVIKFDDLIKKFEDEVIKESTKHRNAVKAIRDLVAPNKAVMLRNGDTEK